MRPTHNKNTEKRLTISSSMEMVVIINMPRQPVAVMDSAKTLVKLTKHLCNRCFTKVNRWEAMFLFHLMTTILQWKKRGKLTSIGCKKILKNENKTRRWESGKLKSKERQKKLKVVHSHLKSSLKKGVLPGDKISLPQYPFQSKKMLEVVKRSRRES